MLLFLDGQAHYDSSRIAAKYSSMSNTNCTWAVTAEGRFGNCLKRASTVNGGTPSGYVAVSPLMTRSGVWTPTTGGVCGFAIKVDDVQRAVADIPVFSPGSNTGLVCIYEGTMPHLLLALNADGTLTLFRYGNGGGGSLRVLAQSSEGLTSATWLFVECKWVISKTTTGSVEVRVNGVPVLTYTGRTAEDEFNTTLGVWNLVRIGGVNSTAAPFLVLRLCDLYLADLAGGAADDVDDFLGDGTIATILPNGVGSATGWTPSAGANWDTVNDRPLPDDDATYVSTLTPGVTDLYQFEDIPADAIVKGVHVNILARKETEGSAGLAPLVQPPGSGPLAGPTQGVGNILYDRYLTQPYDLNPATGVAFTATEINTGQFGMRKVL